MKPRLYMMMGLPGSGKTHYINKHLKYIPIVSPDEIRLEIFNTIFDKEVETYVWSMADMMVRKILFGNMNVVFDATMTKKVYRYKLISDFRDECYIFGIHMDTPFDVCVERRKNFPIDVMERMYKEWEEPEYKEGFTSIWRIKS